MDTTGSTPQGMELSDLEREVMLKLQDNLQQWSTYRYDELGRELARAEDALDRAMQNLSERGLIIYDTPLQSDSQMRLTEEGRELVDRLEGRGGDSGKQRNAL
jgi:hypothetical protein